MSGPQPDPWYGEGSISDPTAGGPYVEQTAGPGEAATEIQRQLFNALVRAHSMDWCAEERLTDVAAAAVPVVAALVAAAEERGRVEGAAKERERIELWLRMLAEETDRHGPGLRDLGADLRWAANRMADDLRGSS